MDTTTSAGTPEATTYSRMVGVFRERTNAEQALHELKQAGFQETELTAYDPHPTEEAVDSIQGDAGIRFLVHVLAEGREQEAVAILVSHGANNADLPLGTTLDQGSLIGAPDEQDAIHAAVGGASESFFGAANTSGHPQDISVMDTPDTSQD